MKQILLSFCFFVSIPVMAQESIDAIRLNSIGYLPDAPKKASIVEKIKKFEVVDLSTNKVVFNGKTTDKVYQSDVNQEIWVADFTPVNKPGTYALRVPGIGQSSPFKIGDDVYENAFLLSFNGLYLWRCGSDVHFEHKGNKFEQKACHLEDGYLDYIGEKGIRKDGTGGWHDAGDYGKYTVNAGISIAMLFYAWDHFSHKIKDFDLGIPQTAPEFPDYLEELKWETDWLLKMQYPDNSGKVSHKLTRLNFSGFIMPNEDKDKRYFSPYGTAAIADFTATMAMAARYFEPYNPEYAKKCLDAALLSYKYLKENPEYVRFEQGPFNTGGYQTFDADDRLWASAELWETTGESRYLQDLEEKIKTANIKIDADWDWSDVSNLAMFTYVLSEREGKDPALQEEIRNKIILNADSIVKTATRDVYGRTLGGKYYWGCNGTIVRQTLNLQIAYRLIPKEIYKHAALDAIAHVFGRNYYNRSYVTGLGINPPMHPHDRRCGADGIEDPWPGYIVGGGHSATDWVDLEADYSRNEIALNWQAALIYALAGFLP